MNLPNDCVNPKNSKNQSTNFRLQKESLLPGWWKNFFSRLRLVRCIFLFYRIIKCLRGRDRPFLHFQTERAHRHDCSQGRNLRSAIGRLARQSRNLNTNHQYMNRTHTTVPIGCCYLRSALLKTQTNICMIGGYAMLADRHWCKDNMSMYTRVGRVYQYLHSYKAGMRYQGVRFSGNKSDVTRETFI